MDFIDCLPKSLRSLRIVDCPIVAKDLIAVINRFTGIQQLKLKNVYITDAINAIENMPELRELKYLSLKRDVALEGENAKRTGRWTNVAF